MEQRHSNITSVSARPKLVSIWRTNCASDSHNSNSHDNIQCCHHGIAIARVHPVHMMNAEQQNKNVFNCYYHYYYYQSSTATTSTATWMPESWWMRTAFGHLTCSCRLCGCIPPNACPTTCSCSRPMTSDSGASVGWMPTAEPTSLLMTWVRRSSTRSNRVSSRLCHAWGYTHAQSRIQLAIQGWQVSAEGGLNRGLKRFKPVRQKQVSASFCQCKFGLLVAIT